MIKTLVSWLIGVICLVIIILSLLLTPAGLKISLFIYNQISSGHISYTTAQGLISGPIHFINFSYDDQNITVKLKELSFDWELSDLFKKTFTINDLEANHAVILFKNKTTHTNANMKNNSSEFKLPSFNLNIQQANIKNVFFKNNNTVIAHLKKIHIQASFSSTKSNITIIDYWLKPLKFNNVISVIGTPQNYNITMNNQIGSNHLTLWGHGNHNGLQLKTKQSSSKKPIAVNLILNWLPHLSWNLTMSGNNIDFKNIINNVSNKNKFNIKSQGSLIKQQPIFSLQTTIHSEDSHLYLKLSHNIKWQAQWDLNINNQFYSWPIKMATIQSKGNFQGNLDNLISHGQADITSLSFNNIKVNKLNSKWDVSSDLKHLSNINITAHGINAKQLIVPNLNLKVRGNLIHHLIEANFLFNQTPIHLNLVGHYLLHKWSTVLNQFTITPKDKFSLVKPIEFQINNKQLMIPNICIASVPNQKLCANFNWKNGTWNSEIKGSNLNPNNILTHFLPNYIIKSKANLLANLSGMSHALRAATMELHLSAGSFFSNTTAIHDTHKILKSFAHITLKDNKLNSKVSIKMNHDNHILGYFNVKNFNQPDSNLSGSINIKLTDFKPPFTSTPHATNSQSKMLGNLTIAGTITKPLINGKFNLQFPAIYLASLNTSLDNVKVSLTAKQQQINTTAVAYSNGKPITLTTESQFENNKFTTTAHLVGKDILLANTPEYKIYANPDLTAIIRNHKISLHGSLFIPSAHIKPDLSDSIISLPENDVIIIGDSLVNQPNKWTLQTNINTQIGDSVFIDIIGINAQLTGQVKITKKPYQTTLATGHILVIKGTYKHYGHTLTVQPNSAIIFTNSPLISPTLNVKASNTIQVATSNNNIQVSQNDIIVGIHLTGLLRHPKISFYSIPSTLTQPEILTYLVLGSAAINKDSPTGNNTASNGMNNLLTAINALKLSETALSKYGGFTEEIRNSLGLSELGVQQTETIDAIGNSFNQQTTSFIVGKYLTKNIYLRYSYEYLNEMNTPKNNTSTFNELQISLLLNDSFTIQLMTTTGGGSNAMFIDPTLENKATFGADLIYTIKR